MPSWGHSSWEEQSLGSGTVDSGEEAMRGRRLVCDDDRWQRHWRASWELLSVAAAALASAAAASHHAMLHVRSLPALAAACGLETGHFLPK